MVRRWLPLLVLGALLAHAASGCVGGTDDTALKPQPLPPSDSSGDDERSGGTTGSSGDSSTPGVGANDSGAPASDSGEDGGANDGGDDA